MSTSTVKRLDRHEYFLRMATLVSLQSTCLRRAVGCVLVDGDNHVVATGYNGVPRGVPHCSAGWPCPAANAAPGTHLDGCLATHSEQNALLQCRDVESLYIAYCTDSPCMTCVKLLLNTSCSKIVFSREYPHPEAAALWRGQSREWVHVPLAWPFVLEQSHAR